jgi:hypothetical protein
MEKVDFNIEYAHIYANEFRRDEIIGEEQMKSVEVVKQIIGDLETIGKSYSLNILVDDYNEEVTKVDEKALFSQLNEIGLPPDHVMRESQLAVSSAEILIEAMSDRYLDKQKPYELTFIPKSNDIRLWAPNHEDQSFRRILWEHSQGEKKEDFSKERELRERAEALISRESFRTKSEIVLQYTGDDGTTRYTCPLLTACWHLVRLGVKPFAEEYKNIKSFTSKPFFGDRLITVLSSGYLKIEGTAMEIISLAKSKTIKKQKSRLEYYFF